MIGDSDVLINRKMAIDALCKVSCISGYCEIPCEEVKAIEQLPPVYPRLCGYKVEQLAIIATVLQKEGLSPDRVTEALTDIDRIISMVRDEFSEALKKAVEQNLPVTDKIGESEL